MLFDKLPPEVREFISPLEHALFEEIRVTPTDDTDILRDIAKQTWLQKVQPYYKRFNLEANNGIPMFFFEPLKNANYHGSASSMNPIRFNIYMTQVALVASYRDGGLYFTRQDVKEAYENKKIRHPEKHVIEPNRHDDVGYGAGTGTIYDTSDFIHVETTTATLFTGVSTRSIFFNILKPQP